MSAAIMNDLGKDLNVWVIYLEVVIALGLVLLIVWWTMRGKK
jgi:hypothetical protein